MPTTKDAVALHLTLSHPPHLSNRKISLNTVHEFENHCKNYYMNAKGGIEDDQKVTKILSCFESPLINNWILVNHAWLKALTFENFMSELQSKMAPP